MKRYIIYNQENCEIANVDKEELKELIEEGIVQYTDRIEEYESEDD